MKMCCIDRTHVCLFVPYHDPSYALGCSDFCCVTCKLIVHGPFPCPCPYLGFSLSFWFDVFGNDRRQWLCESETIVNEHNKLLFCALPNSGAMQFRMLAKRMRVTRSAAGAVSPQPDVYSRYFFCLRSLLLPVVEGRLLFVLSLFR